MVGAVSLGVPRAEIDQLNDQNKFCYMLTRTHVAPIVGQFIIDAFDNRPVKV